MDSIPTKGEQNTRYVIYIFTRDVTLAYDDDAIGDLGFRDVTLAYDDDANGTKGVRDVTLAYDDDAIGALDFRNVTLAHDDHTKETMASGM